MPIFIAIKSTERLASRGPPLVTLANFVEYAKAKPEVFSVDDGEKRKEIHVAFCDGRSGTGFVLPHIWNFYLFISNMSFSEEQTKIDLFGLTLGRNA